MTLDAHYADPILTALYDFDSGWSADRDYYRALPSAPRSRILDVGCGTGLLIAAYAEDGHDVTGLDPAPAMLDIARKRAGDERVNWECGYIDDLASHADFDLITMTGNAFQVLLNDEATHAFLNGIARHLAKDGRFVFETRNPAIDWATKWTGVRSLETGDGTIEMRREIDAIDAETISFSTYYEITGTEKTSKSTLRFVSYEKLAIPIDNAGLKITRCDGDWDANPYDPETSHAIIITAQLQSP